MKKAGRYAKALFTLDQSKEKREERVAEFEQLIPIVKAHPKLTRMVQAPHISMEEKKKVVKKSLQPFFHPDFIHFLLYLLQRGNWELIPSIAHEYKTFVDEERGIEVTQMITAVAMESDIEERLKKKLEEAFQKKMKIKKKVDPKIIGGVMILMKNKMLDWSIEGRLRKLKEKIDGI